MLVYLLPVVCGRGGDGGAAGFAVGLPAGVNTQVGVAGIPLHNVQF